MQQSNLEELFRAATANHQAGKFADAERGYRQVVAADADFGHAWHMLGVLAYQQQRYEEAAELIRRAIAAGMGADAHNNLGEVLRASNRFDEAIAAYQSAIDIKPDYAVAHSNLGAALNEVSRYVEALPHLEQALKLVPGHPNILFNYGLALEKVGKRDDAMKQWEAALRIQPGHVQAMFALATAMHRADRPESAATLLRQAIAHKPNFADAHANLSRALAALNHIEQALKHANRAIELQPGKASHYTTLGVVYSAASRYQEAVEATRKAIELNPRSAEAVASLGEIEARMNHPLVAEKHLQRAMEMCPGDPEIAGTLSAAQYTCARLEEALDTLDEAIKLNPHYPLLHRNRGFVLLAMNRYIEGFEEYEWRWRDQEYHNPPRHFAQPMWDGRDPAGRKILVHTEQGFGDVLQFARYLPMLVEAGADVIVEVLPPLRDLIASVSPAVRVIASGVALPAFDWHVPIMSLAKNFKTTLESIPKNIPYLHPQESVIARWKRLIDANRRRLNVGLVWGGNALPDPRRSIALTELAPLGDIPDVTWFSLQMGPPRGQLKEAPARMHIVDVGEKLGDFADSAAVLSMLDLLITIDTSAAHLAGAMGVRTWTFLPDTPDWRWMMAGDSTPWYPQMRLFRQEPQSASWEGAVRRVREALAGL